MEPSTKKDLFLDLLGKIPQVFVRLDARKNGVVLPEDLKDSPILVLTYGLDMPIPIHDLVANDDGITATLSFGRTPHKTFVPWPAIYIIGSEDEGCVYTSDVPPEVGIMTAPPAPARSQVPTPLGVMEGGGEKDAGDTERARPVLTLVK